MNRNGGMWFRATLGSPVVLEVILGGDLPLLKCERGEWYYVAKDEAQAEQSARNHFRQRWLSTGRSLETMPKIKASEYWARKGQYQWDIQCVSSDLLVKLGFRPTVMYRFR